jgi:FkbM family methyltransferase
MTEIEKIIKLEGDFDKIIQIVSDIKYADKLLSPFNFKNKIKKVENQKVIVDEKIKFPFIKTLISQESSYEFLKPNKTKIQILSGPFKGTKIGLKYENTNNQTNVHLNLELKINFKYIFFKSIIKNRLITNFKNVIMQIDRLAILTQGKRWDECIIENGEGIKFLHNKSNVELYGWSNSSFTEIFVDESYNMLPINEKIVFDIGANIGDSSIYFALHNAKKVIAIEPFPSNFELLKKNIFENKLDSKIDLHLIAIAKDENTVSVDPNYIGTSAGDSSSKHGFSIKNQNDGQKIPTKTLKNLIDTYKIEDAVLKVDCEGCEYDMVLNSNSDTIRKFSHIVIEFHRGFEDLKEKLEKCNFNVNVNTSKKNISGFIFAVRK